MSDPRRHLPAVHRLCTPELVARYGQARVTAAARAVLAQARESGSGPDGLVPALEAYLDVGVRPVINATGVILHTNLGRAPWSAAAIAAASSAAGYADVELDLQTGKRGGREAGVRRRLQALTGAEDALVVNNCAAAVLLCLGAIARGRGVIVSRGQLVEIGGKFRVPDIMSLSGADLVEVGTTNRTRIADFESAITPEVAAVLHVHHSNFRQIGFVESPTLAELGGLSVPLIVDLGSGQLDHDPPEPSVAEALAANAALVCFSGDKLLGGPQSGIVIGQKAWVDQLRSHPFYRALRTDKVTQAALEATLDGWLTGALPPAQQMIDAPITGLDAVAKRWLAALPPTVEAETRTVDGAIGGGTHPGQTWPSVALAITAPDPRRLHAALLQRRVVGRIHDGALLLDARTVAPLGQADALLAALLDALTEFA